ncbi:sigma-70 family RNA polymerase sigma factor [Pseudodesulfovibrio sp. zrk46]|uniref:RNA polymerase sigma factor n=1 Tax=Pseudodesulfovibrio sp. zrk46 TaxID=2725288 RepID=UPI001448AAB4|nr:sigma-70 family RNA polymerase sigma factor [Pseudodesulfovibrio sp. zrk46]QJB57226.1 sigma-70 family RNA polymerase sigma factor [Pseudodesulfovibrio sp. zrk46]
MSNISIEIDRSHGTVSYNELFQDHSRLIFKLINNFIKAKNINLHTSEVDDIFQEVALKIFKNDYLTKYNNEKSSFITWLNIICRTTAIDYYRKKIRWMESVLTKEDTTAQLETADPVVFSLPAGVLTDRQAQVITLFFQEGLVAREIAAALDITPRTVRSIKFQALERLRNHYGASAPIAMPEAGEARRKVS